MAGTNGNGRWYTSLIRALASLDRAVALALIFAVFFGYCLHVLQSHIADSFAAPPDLTAKRVRGFIDGALLAKDQGTYQRIYYNDIVTAIYLVHGESAAAETVYHLMDIGLPVSDGIMDFLKGSQLPSGSLPVPVPPNYVGGCP